MKIISSFELKNSVINYVSDVHPFTQKEQYELQLLPKGMPAVDERKEYLVQPLVQLALANDLSRGGHINGASMRNGLASYDLEMQEQIVDGNHIVTVMKNSQNHTIEHHLTMLDDAVETYTVFKNTSDEDTRLEMITSFNLGSLSPYFEGQSEGVLVHRLRSFWSFEGKLDTRKVEELMIEPSWGKWSFRSEKYGSIGSYPVRNYFPFIAIEDTKHGVIWGAQLYLASSWQMEIDTMSNGICISGGIADFDYGHWFKDVKAGEEFTTPKAVLAVAKGSIDDISNKLVGVQVRNIDAMPEVEKDMPIAFNEWCTTWGHPTEENVKRIADKLRGTGVTYLTIDDGWFRQKEDRFQGDWQVEMGNWNVAEKQFPNGIKSLCDYVREAGMIPGIWFEMEVVHDANPEFADRKHLLTRNGLPLKPSRRLFLDMRDPWVIDHLTKKVINFLKDNGFGYIKVDYNDNIGVGCDGKESLGEGLRDKICATQDFFRKMREEIPDLVIENCASGGHRLEPSMMAISSQASFSDAHECTSIPIIAANVQRAIHPAQSQIWAVLRENDTTDRLYYSLSATMLGRMCLSGDIYDLDDAQWAIVQEAIDFYKQISHLIKCGNSYRFGEPVERYNYPTGYQVMLRKDGEKALIIAHTFDIDGEVTVELPDNYKVINKFGSDEITLKDNKVAIKAKSFTATAFYAEKM